MTGSCLSNYQAFDDIHQFREDNKRKKSGNAL